MDSRNQSWPWRNRFFSLCWWIWSSCILLRIFASTQFQYTCYSVFVSEFGINLFGNDFEKSYWQFFKCFTEFDTENGLCWEAVDTDQLPLSWFFRLSLFCYQSNCCFCTILVYILFSLYWSSVFSHANFTISYILKLWYLSLCHFFFLGLLYPWLWLQHGFLSVEGEWKFVELRDFSFNIEGYGKI